MELQNQAGLKLPQSNETQTSADGVGTTNNTKTESNVNVNKTYFFDICLQYEMDNSGKTDHD